MVGAPAASDGFGFAAGPPSSMSTTRAAATLVAAALMPEGAMNTGDHGPWIAPDVIQPSKTWMKKSFSTARCRIKAFVLITRWRPATPVIGRSTGGPSIGTRMAGELLTITFGTLLCTAAAGADVAASAGDCFS
jgi:hypothetical protein